MAKKKAGTTKRKPVSKKKPASGKRSVKKKKKKASGKTRETSPKGKEKKKKKKKAKKKSTARKTVKKKKSVKRKKSPKRKTRKTRAAKTVRSGKKSGTKSASTGSKKKKQARRKRSQYYKSATEAHRDSDSKRSGFSQRQEAQQTLEKHRSQLYRRKNVTGLHVGLKKVDGQIVRPVEYVICIHVKRKDTRSRSPLPKKLGNVETEILVRNYRSTLAPGNENDNDDARKDKLFSSLMGGIAISRESAPGDFGTLGMIVFHFGQKMYLTNQHVAGDPGEDMRHPPTDKNVPFAGREKIGTTFLTSFDDDCAIIEPNAARRSKQQIDLVEATADEFIDGELDIEDEGKTRVIKVGATTGLTRGIVESISFDLNVPGQRTFDGQILVGVTSANSTLIAPGDSGSVLLKEERRSFGVIYRVVGLVHAETVQGGSLVATHFRDVKKALGIRLHSRFS